MEQCLAPLPACAAACCDTSALADRISALEDSPPAPEANALLAALHYLVENATEILALAAAVAAVVGTVLLARFLWRWLAPADLKLKSATLNIGSSSVTVEAAAAEISDFLLDLQDHVIGDAAGMETRLRAAFGSAPAPGTARLGTGDLNTLIRDLARTIANPPAESFAVEPQVPETPKGLPILWVAPRRDSILFQSRVLERMGNAVDVVSGRGDALIRLRGTRPPAVIVLDASDGGEDALRLQTFAADLLRGIRAPIHVIDAPAARIGPDLRLALLTATGAARGQYEALRAVIASLPPADRTGQVENLLVTDNPVVLRERIRWLQRQSAP
jgi:CheY-like chemotaxis protein